MAIPDSLMIATELRTTENDYVRSVLDKTRDFISNIVHDVLPSASDLVQRFKEDMPEKYQIALSHLSDRYCLSEEDMRGHEKAFYKLLNGINPIDDFFLYFCKDKKLLEKSIRNAIKENDFSYENDYAQVVVNPIRNDLDPSFTSMRFFIKPYLSEMLRYEAEFEKARIPERRESVIQSMDNNPMFTQLFKDWESEFEHALSDEQMKYLFRPQKGGNRDYLTTYFDTAQYGIYSESLQDAADEIAEITGQSWRNFLLENRHRITMSLEAGRRSLGARRFNADGCSFHENGSMAFNAFSRAFVSNNTRVLATNEEYGGIIDIMEDNGANVEILDDYVDPIAYSERISEALGSGDFDYILVSESSRYGTVFPLSEFNKKRKQFSPKTKLIVDSCQSAGRVQHDMATCEADIVVLSTNKGSDFGRGLGVLALSKDLKHPGKVYDTLHESYSGTVFHQGISRTGFSMMPEGLFLRGGEPKYTLSPKERGDSVSAITKMFIDMVDIIDNDRIQIIRPRYKGKLSHAIEIKVKGVNRNVLCDNAKKFGVYMSSTYADPYDDESVRLGFHPFMSQDSLKILSYVLLEATKK